MDVVAALGELLTRKPHITPARYTTDPHTRPGSKQIQLTRLEDRPKKTPRLGGTWIFLVLGIVLFLALTLLLQKSKNEHATNQ